MGKGTSLNRVVREHLADDDRASTQKPEAERQGLCRPGAKAFQAAGTARPEVKYALCVQRVGRSV